MILREETSFGDIGRRGSSGGLPSAGLFWALGFVYACLMALMLQKLLLPLMPSLHAGHGLLLNDALVYHEMAKALADNIRSQGWGAWRLLPVNGAGGNVGVLGALYALFGPDPAWFIPINAAAHATGGLMFYKIGSRFWRGPVGQIGGLVAGILFLIFPSALQWYGQNLKDAFAIAGFLMMLYAQLRAYDEGIERPGLVSGVMLTVGGGILIGSVRPYFPVLILAAFIPSWLALVGFVLCRGAFVRNSRRIIHGFILVGVVAATIPLTMQTRASSSAFEGGLTKHGAGHLVAMTGWRWHRSDTLPRFIDHGFESASAIRAHFVGFNRSVNAGSGIDEDRLPEDVTSMIAYLPRALMIGLFSPFPDSWAERTSAPRLVGAMETAVWYLLFPGVVLLCCRRLSPPLLFGMSVVLVLLTIQGYVYPNVGNLYRQRYAFWMFVLAVGAVGWASVFAQRLRSNRGGSSSESSVASLDALEKRPTEGMEVIVAAGALVIGITLVCYLGFLARDLLLVRMFGMNASLDGYFFAAMLPMFFVTCLTMPMSDALMRPFLDTYFSEGLDRATRLARTALSYGLIGTGVLSIVLSLFAEPVMRIGLKNADAAQLQDAVTMFRCCLPLLALSPWTVIGNAILNGLRLYRSAALAQLVVPATAILAIILSPSEYGAYSAIFGMVGGAVLNLFLVVWCLARLGVALWPKPLRMSTLPSAVVTGYRQLALAGLVGATAIPLGYAFAGTVGEGGISTWALASKMTTLFTGLASVGVASVILPRLARAMRDHHLLLRNHFLGLIFGGTWIGGVAAALICLFSLPIAAAVVGDGAAGDRIETFANVLRIGALQLPIILAYTVMMKTSAAIGTSARALVGSGLGLMSYAVLAYLSVGRFGVLGIAASALASGAFATLYLAIRVRRVCGFGFGEVAVLVLGWGVWMGICLAAIQGGVAAILCATTGLTALAWVQFRVLAPRQEIIDSPVNAR